MNLITQARGKAPVYASQLANRVLASPNGSSGKPTFRALVPADIPALPATIITSGQFTVQLSTAVTDAVTNAVTYTVVGDHLNDGTGNPAANFGSGILLRGHTSNRTRRNMASLEAAWDVATDGSHTSRASLYIYNGNTAVLAEVHQINGSSVWSGFGGIPARKFHVRDAAQSIFHFTTDLTGNTGSDGTSFSVTNGDFTIVNREAARLVFATTGTTRFQIEADGTITLANGINIAVNTSTGTKIGTATTQKLGFWNVTPIVQPSLIANPSGGATQDAEARTALIAVLTLLKNTGLMAAA